MLFVGVFSAHCNTEVDSASELLNHFLKKKAKAFVMIKKQEFKLNNKIQ